MSDQNCPGSCNSQFRRSRALYDVAMTAYQKAIDSLRDGDKIPEPPTEPDIRPWLGEPVWCTRCQAVIRRELAELDDLAALLAAMPPGIRPAITGQREHVKVSGTRGTESPSPAIDDLEELAGWLRNWESAYRGQDPQARRGYLAREMTNSIAQLLWQLDGILAHEDLALDFGRETRAWHRRLTAATHAGSAAKHVKQPCPRCGLYTIWETYGKDYLECVNEDCNRRLTRAELAADVAIA